jgi:hypothetical protein
MGKRSACFSVLGGGIDDDVGAVVEGLADHRRRGVVDDQGHTQLFTDLRHLADREDVKLGVGQGFRIVGPGFVVGGPAEVFRIGGIDETDLDPHGLEGVGEEVPGAAIEVGGADDVVSRAGDVLDREGRGRLAGGDRQGRCAAFQCRDPLLQHVAGRVHDPGVDIAQLLQREELGGMLGAVELIGGGLVDRHRHGTRGRIVAVAGVEHDGLGIAGRHGH